MYKCILGGVGLSYRNLMDMHVHSDNSHDAHHSVTLVCEKAVAKGLRAIAVTDHCNIIDYYKDKQNIICRQAAFEVKKAADVFNGQIIVSSGVELGSPARDDEAVKDVLKNKFDFVVASVHRIKGKKKSFLHYDYKREANRPECLIPRYLDGILETVEWNGFDSLAHLTFPLRYFPPELLADFDLWQYRDRLEAILKKLAQNGKSLEINTKGDPLEVNGKTHSFQPDFEIVKLFHELGGEHITVGSDAHSAHDIGNRVAEAYDMAVEAGFKYVTLYQHRTPLPIKIV